SYMEMEKRFKVYVYKEGDPPMVHDGPCKNKYTSEGRFIQEMEQAGKKKKKSGFRTWDAHRAHVYFLPFSVTWMVKYLYKPLSNDLRSLQEFVGDYGPHASRGHAQLYNTSIRVLCNANSSEGFNPQKDVTLPEIHLYSGEIDPKLLSPPPRPATPRPHLAFFAGGARGPIRSSVLRHWKDLDTDIRVYEYLPENLDYYTLMLESKFCLCPSGYEVATPRTVEAIYAECIPVILSENYVLPFSDVLRWEEFSVAVEVSDIGRLKDILMGVGEEKYLRLKEGLRAVRRHFVLNQPAQRFDAFHMETSLDGLKPSEVLALQRTLMKFLNSLGKFLAIEVCSGGIQGPRQHGPVRDAIGVRDQGRQLQGVAMVLC
ncbi:hypothetical protein C3L33_15908, partial [Rhododendron williamsianum]